VYFLRIWAFVGEVDDDCTHAANANKREFTLGTPQAIALPAPNTARIAVARPDSTAQNMNVGARI